MTRFRRLFFALMLAICCSLGVNATQGLPGSFTLGQGRFLADGKPVTIKAAELHYPRIPRPYWKQRIEMVKSLGMNAVCLYVFWNVHESHPDQFDFTGQNDLREFVRLCEEAGLMVILRPGPYVCAEWEMGGLPWWLLTHPDIRLREQDPYFIGRVERFMEHVAQEVGDLTVANGGPIIMVQVENEYGSYGTDKPYISTIRDIVRRNFGEDALLFQCDWSSNFTENGLDDLLWTLNFGTWADVEEEFAPLRALRPDTPLMCSEYWSGWFDKWGAAHETRPAEPMIEGMRRMLDRDISFSLYMTHGGTNWGHWAGANSPGFAPDVTSYDYDAPINEWGYPTQKYYLLRDLLAKYSDTDSLPPMPALIPLMEVPQFELTSVAPLMLSESFTGAIHSDSTLTMEMLGQGFGSILYTTPLPSDIKGGTVLRITEPHDYAQVWIGERFIGSVDRRLGETEIILPEASAGDEISILVEAMGRINFGRAIKDFKGITEGVDLVTTEGEISRLGDWSISLFPDEYEYYTSLQQRPVDSIESDEAHSCRAQEAKRTAGDRLPGVYAGTFRIESVSDTIGDTFLDMSDWGKGLVYVNGHPLGRFWEIGPQQTLYMPGCWLREGENEILIVDIIGPKARTLRGLSAPLLDSLAETDRTDIADPTYRPELDGIHPTAELTLRDATGWQSFDLATDATGSLLAIEIASAYDDVKGVPAISEIQLYDGEGKLISADRWRARYVSSQQSADGNHTLDKAFDIQESTWWQAVYPMSEDKPLMLIDLTEEVTVSSIRILPAVHPDTAIPRRIDVYIMK